MDCQNKKSSIRKWMGYSVSAFLACMILVPVLIPFIYLFLGPDEAARTLGGVLDGGRGYASLILLPAYPSLEPLKELFFYCQEFYRSFWNSVLYAGGTAGMQLVVGMPTAWALGQYSFRGRGTVYALYLFLMILPFQVTMVSNYLLFDRIGLLDSVWVILLPGMFSAFPVFLMTNFFENVPKEALEAARVDGAGEWRIFLQIGVPMGKAGVMAAVVLNFIEYWNMIEPPLAFLRREQLEPLSLFLPEWNADTAGSIFAASAAAMILPVLLFLWGRRYLEEGISCMAVRK